VPVLEVWNKTDLLAPEAREALLVQDARSPGGHAVSALTGQGLGALIAAIGAALDAPRTEEEVALPFAAGRQRAWLHEQGVVQGEAQDETGYRLRVAWTARQKAAFRALG
jgi:GTP-binding protein HflX